MNVQYCHDPTIGPPVCCAQRRMAVCLLGLLLMLGLYMFVSHQLHNEHRLQRLQAELTAINAELCTSRQHDDEAAATALSPGAVEAMLRKYTAKLKTDLERTRGDLQQMRSALSVGGVGERVDYALESVGGSVISTGNTRLHRNAVEAVLRTMCAAVSAVFANASPLSIIGRNAPLRIIQPTRAIGDCFGFYGSSGEVTLRLQRAIHVEAVSVDHIRREMSPMGNVTSAPKRFGVYGLNGATGAQHFFGSYEYRIGDDVMYTLQTFEIPEALQAGRTAFEMVTFRFLSNHGNEDYTCVYQVKVHGRPEGEAAREGKEEEEEEFEIAVVVPPKRNITKC